MTFDYNKHGCFVAIKQKCFCGATNCRKYLDKTDLLNQQQLTHSIEIDKNDQEFMNMVQFDDSNRNEKQKKKKQKKHKTKLKSKPRKRASLSLSTIKRSQKHIESDDDGTMMNKLPLTAAYRVKLRTPRGKYATAPKNTAKNSKIEYHFGVCKDLKKEEIDNKEINFDIFEPVNIHELH